MGKDRSSNLSDESLQFQLVPDPVLENGEQPSSPLQGQNYNKELAILAKGEPTCGDATGPTQMDIQHLCRIWGEVGQAILARRGAKP